MAWRVNVLARQPGLDTGGLFYQAIDLVGLENIPESGPLIVARNTRTRWSTRGSCWGRSRAGLVPVAKAPLFRYPLTGPLLRLVGALPVPCRQEGGVDPARSRAMFSAATAHLGASQAVPIFPEGVSHPDPALMPLRTGAARMLLEAEAAAGGNCGVASCRLVSSSTSRERSARGVRYSHSEARSPPPIASPSTRSLPTGLRAA